MSMKKIISMILTLAFVLAALSAIMPNASAKSDTITEAEIVDLIERSWDFYRAAGCIAVNSIQSCFFYVQDLASKR